MRTKTKTRCMMGGLLLVAIVLYAAAAYRAEQSRSLPRLDPDCSSPLCLPHNASFDWLR